MRSLEIYKQPQRFLNTTVEKNHLLAEKILEALESLLSNPLPHSSKKLVGYKDLYRVRIEKYRVVYSFDAKIVHVLLIKKRDEIYSEIKKLK